VDEALSKAQSVCLCADSFSVFTTTCLKKKINKKKSRKRQEGEEIQEIVTPSVARDLQKAGQGHMLESEEEEEEHDESEESEESEGDGYAGFVLGSGSQHVPQALIS
jgi:hypothetical protein